MRQRYAKIIQDLQQHFQNQGYSATRARLKAEDLFHEKNSIYYPLVHHGSPNLQGLKPNETRNPYGTQSLPNTATDNYNLGLICQKVGNFEQAAQLYHLAAATGHAGAEASLAYLFEMGWGVPADASQAVSFYSRAARQGHAVAQYMLGQAHENGLGGLPQSHERAVELYKLGAAQGDAAATDNLGACYANGLGVDQSVAEARRLYGLAVARGDSEDSENARANLQTINDRIQQYCPLLGQRMVLRGLNTAALNGMCGTSVDFGFTEKDPETGDWVAASGRYTVRLDGPEGRLVKVRAANVEEEEKGPGARR